jgi:glyoxylase-like metal-dependent hydrolase (beta-lactamase superfamily II)
VLERGWLSSNNIVFQAYGTVPATVIDTGYVSQSQLSVDLLQSVLGEDQLGRIVNTHLHSDHCGGNARLVERYSAKVLVPERSFDAARRWDENLLSYSDTGQFCARFNVDGAISAESEVCFGAAKWRVIAAPGHDSDAVMFFEPTTRILISGDALWEDRLAIVFPEIDGEPGFRAARATLDVIERLQPSIVIPGHGCAFTDITRTFERNRRRLDVFERYPERHLHHAVRALTMFHMLELRSTTRAALVDWLQRTPIFDRLHQRLKVQARTLGEFAAAIVDELLSDAHLVATGETEISIRQR